MSDFQYFFFLLFILDSWMKGEESLISSASQIFLHIKQWRRSTIFSNGVFQENWSSGAGKRSLKCFNWRIGTTSYIQTHRKKYRSLEISGMKQCWYFPWAPSFGRLSCEKAKLYCRFGNCVKFWTNCTKSLAFCKKFSFFRKPIAK